MNLNSNVCTNSNENRRLFIGGSDARIIMGDDEEALLRLWQEKRAQAEPQDFTGNLLVQLGLATEDLNRRWYERTTGEIIKDVQNWIRHPVIRWMAATLDGVVESTGAVFEAKCPGRSRKRPRPKNTCRSSSTTCG
jgi:predicted phage-related endonuclease